MHFRDQGKVHNPTSKLLKSDFVQTLVSYGTLLWEFLLPGRHLLFFEIFTLKVEDQQILIGFLCPTFSEAKLVKTPNFEQ